VESRHTGDRDRHPRNEIGVSPVLVNVGARRTTMLANMTADETGTSRLAEVFERSASAEFRLAYLLTGDPALAGPF
jgi:hypothetical protein